MKIEVFGNFNNWKEGKKLHLS